MTKHEIVPVNADVCRVVALPNRRAIRLGAYVAAWKMLKGVPPNQRYRGFYDHEERADTILRAMRYGIHDRINRHIPNFGKGRNWSDETFWEWKRLARAVNTPRLIVRAQGVPARLRQRLAHRLATEDCA